jgi:hypothetical protein
MHKIPVGETISGAYGFAFAGFLTVLGTVWFPFLLLFAIDGGAIYLIAPDLPAQLMHGNIDTSFIYSLHRVRGIFTLASFIIGAMVAVGLQQRALGQVQGPTFFFFSLGASVWRMLGAYFLAFVALIFISVITGGIATVLCIAAVHYVPHFGGIAIAVILGIAAFCWVIYACVRLTFFLPAVVVAEQDIGLIRAWELGGGNFWRIIAVAFVVFVPVLVGMGLVWQAVIGPLIPLDLLQQFHPHMSDDQVNALTVALAKRIVGELRVAFPIFVTLIAIQHLIFLGLGNGAVGKAYLGATDKG